MRVLLVLAILVLVSPGTTSAGGIIPERVNQLIIEGRFDQPQPQFLVIFSAQRLVDARGKPLTSATADELRALATANGQVVLKLQGKPAVKSGRVDYFFGTQADADMPWNNGQEFRWQDWEKHSADVWDHVSIAAVPEKRKYANRGNNWCSEFATHVYRSNELLTPDPNKGDVHFRNMAGFFRSNGHVYPMREVVAWSDAEKQAKIKPGSFVSILIGDSTHSLIFTTWVRPDRGQKITKYAAVSGNNKGMVWPHDPLTLPAQKDFEKMSTAEIAEYDQKVYFGVPGQ